VSRFHADMLTEWAPLARPVQQMIMRAFPALREHLLANDHLHEDLTISFVTGARPDDLDDLHNLLAKGRLTRSIAEAVLANQHLVGTGVADKAAVWLTSTYATLPDGWAERLAASGNTGSLTATKLLLHPDTPAAVKQQILTTADYDVALGWILSAEGAATSDGQAATVLLNPSGGFVHDTAVRLAIRLLELRPQLVDRVIEAAAAVDTTFGRHRNGATERLRYPMIAVSAVPLTAAQQKAYLTAAVHFFDHDDFRRTIGSLLRAPWCTRELHDTADREKYEAAVTYRAQHGWIWAKLDGRPLAAVKGWWRRRWLFTTANMWQQTYARETVARQLAANPHLNPAQRQIVDAILEHTDKLTDGYLDHCRARRLTVNGPVRAGQSQPVWSPEKAAENAGKPVERTAATEVVWHLFHAWGDNVDAWEIGLSLLTDGYDRSIADLADTATLLTDH
jgi:hypothetical protein